MAARKKKTSRKKKTAKKKTAGRKAPVIKKNQIRTTNFRDATPEEVLDFLGIVATLLRSDEPAEDIVRKLRRIIA